MQLLKSRKQFRVEKDLMVRIPRLEKEIGDTVTFENVLMTAGDSVTVGAPFVKGIKVSASVVGHGRADKILVFKKKKRKGYRVLKGHRQGYTDVQVQSIGA